MIVAVLGALAIGLSLGLMGSGGSILTVPILVYLLGHGEKAAIAESLAIVGVIAATGAASRAREVRWGSALWFGVPGMAGAYAGAHAGTMVSGAVQVTLLGVVMLAASGLMFTRVGSREGPPRRWVIVGAGLFVGALTGLVGVGGGFLIVPALVVVGGLPIHAATATSLAVIALNSGVGFAKSVHALGVGEVDGTVVALFGAVGAAGAMAGQRIGMRMSRGMLRRAFAVFLVVVGVLIVWNELPRAASERGEAGVESGGSQEEGRR